MFGACYRSRPLRDELAPAGALQPATAAPAALTPQPKPIMTTNASAATRSLLRRRPDGLVATMRRGCVATACATLLALPAFAHATPPAGDVAQAGVVAYEDGRMAEAGALFERAARAGNRLAQFNYAMMLYRGEAQAQDAGHDAAWGWLRRAAGAGLPQAQYVLAQLYDHGDGVPRSLTTAEEWYRRAADQGHVEAQIALATMYYVGTSVAAPDYQKAARWYLAAARAGEPGAQFLVADMYDKGYGLPRDARLAAHWYRAAARQGDPVAAARLAAQGAAADAPGESAPAAAEPAAMPAAPALPPTR